MFSLDLVGQVNVRFRASYGSTSLTGWDFRARFIETILKKVRQYVNCLLSILAIGPQLQLGALLSPQRQNAHDALAVDRLAVLLDLDQTFKLRSSFRKHVCWAKVQTQGVYNCYDLLNV